MMPGVLDPCASVESYVAWLSTEEAKRLGRDGLTPRHLPVHVLRRAYRHRQPCQHGRDQRRPVVVRGHRTSVCRACKTEWQRARRNSDRGPTYKPRTHVHPGACEWTEDKNSRRYCRALRREWARNNRLKEVA